MRDGVIDVMDSNVPAKLSRFVYGETAPAKTQVDAFNVACLVHDLLRNDFLSLPKQTVNPMMLFRIESPYDIVVYLRVGDKSVFVRRDSFHDLCRKLHVNLQSMWVEGKSTSSAVDSAK